MIKIYYFKRLCSAFLALTVSLAASAEPIVIEGAVPNEATKNAILSKMYAVYGAETART